MPDTRTAPYVVMVRPDGTYQTWDHEPELEEMTMELHYLEQAPVSMLAFPDMGVLWDEQPEQDAAPNGMADNVLEATASIHGPVIIHGPAGEDGELLALPPAIGHYVVAMCEMHAWLRKRAKEQT